MRCFYREPPPESRPEMFRYKGKIPAESPGGGRRFYMRARRAQLVGRRVARAREDRLTGAAYLLAHFVVDRLQQRFLVLAGVEYLILGLLLGPTVPDIQVLGDLTGLLPIIALTADIVSNVQEESKACGMVGFLVKPINRNDLIDILGKYGQTPRAPRAAT